MRLAIAGPGAMGCLFAARLCRSGIETTLIDYREGRAQALRESGIILEEGEGRYRASPGVSTEAPEGQDLIVVMTKAYSTAALRFPSGVPVLTLQNGLGNAETIAAQVGDERVLVGSTCEAATLIAPGHVRLTGSGVTKIGSWASCDPAAAAEVLRGAGFEVETVDAPKQVLWEKAVINAGINPVTALLNVKNGALLELAEARALMRDLVAEAVEAACAEGCRFDSGMAARVEEVARLTGANVSSMLQDVRAGRRTEIDAISGEILRRAKAASLAAPKTTVVWQLVKCLENRTQSRD